MLPGQDYYSNTQNIMNLKYQTSAYSSGAYETFLASNTVPWAGQWKWIDYPCNQGQTPPNCLNGVHVSDTYWSENKL